MHKQPPVTIDHSAFCGANPATSANYSAVGPDGAGFGRDRSHEGDFEFEGCGADALVERRLDREAHAGVEHGCRETAMDGTDLDESLSGSQ